MKKLIVSLAAVAMAVAAQAYSVDWTFTINGATTAGVDGNNYTAYIFKTADWSATAGSTVEQADLNKRLDFAPVATQASAAYKTGPQSFDGVASLDAIAATVVLVDTVNNKWALIGSGNASPYDPEAGSGTAFSKTTTGKAIVGTATSGNLVWGSISGGSSDVPEPTSAMLLLLGVAGLALRRKQA